MNDEIATDHAILRFWERARDTNQSMTEVWENAIPCELPGHSYDEARVSPEHGVVLIFEDGQIRTCLNTTEDVVIDEAHVEAYLGRSIDTGRPKPLSDSSPNEHMRSVEQQ